MCSSNIEATIQNIYDNNDFKTSELELFNLLSIYPEHGSLIYTNIAKLYSKNGQKSKGAELLVSGYTLYKDNIILDLLLTEFSNISLETCKQFYENNLLELQKRDYVYWQTDKTAFESLSERVIWIDNSIIIAMVNNNLLLYKLPNYSSVFSENSVSLIKNEIRIQKLRIIQSATYAIDRMPNSIHPLYFYYDHWAFNVFLQTQNFKKIADSNRYIFIVGTNNFEHFFSEPQVLRPQLAFGLTEEESAFIKNQELVILNKANNARKSIDLYYKNNKTSIIENIKTGKPKILFWTSIFSTAVQYHTRDLMDACKKLGCEVGLAKEISPIHMVGYTYLFEIDKLKPDIIFIIDWFRFELQNIPDEVLFVTWIQDLFNKFWDINNVNRLRDNDIIINHFLNCKNIEEAGYNRKRMFYAPTPANHNIYKPYELTSEEAETYSCDLCVVGNIQSVDEIVELQCRHFANLDDSSKKIIENFILTYKQFVYDNSIIYEEESYKNYIISYFSSKNIHVSEMLIKGFMSYMVLLNNMLYKLTIADWLIDAGYKNVKLWGRGWDNVSKYKPYAMGFAQNGETLSKIFQSSKIVIGFNGYGTTATRALESILSGSFYLCNYVPKIHDLIDINRFLKEDEEIAMFHNQDDFVRKINYYLSNETERILMAEKARDILLNNTTYDSTARKCLQEFARIVSE